MDEFVTDVIIKTKFCKNDVLIWNFLAVFHIHPYIIVQNNPYMPKNPPYRSTCRAMEDLWSIHWISFCFWKEAFLATPLNLGVLWDDDNRQISASGHIMWDVLLLLAPPSSLFGPALWIDSEFIAFFRGIRLTLRGISGHV